MNKTIYIPDELANQLGQHPQLNVSAVCQRALEQEIQRMNTITEQGLVEVMTEDGPRRFRGQEVSYNDKSGWTFYVTAKDAVVVIDDKDRMWVYDGFDKFADEFQGGWHADDVEAVADELGRTDYVPILDI